MAYTYEQILKAQYERIADTHAHLSAELEAARVSEDAYKVTEAADAILALDQQRTALDARAQSFVASQQQHARGNRYGLNQDEIAIANGISGGDANLSNDQRQQIYSHNKQRLQYLRSTGQYRDDQGTVRR
jgi:hypothetical protein